MAEALGSEFCPAVQEGPQVVVWSDPEVQSPVTEALDSKSPTEDPESYGDNECYGKIPISPHSIVLLKHRHDLSLA